MKPIFSGFFRILHGLSLFFALWHLASGWNWAVAALAVMAVAPLLQLALGFDTLQVPHHKLRLPMTSLLVMSSLAVVLVGIDSRGPILWLVLANVGAFLLDTYWATGEPRTGRGRGSGN